METIRNIEKLSANFQGKTKKFLEDPRIKEFGVFLTETYRTQERQIELYQIGRDKNLDVINKNKLVTWVDGVMNKSRHQVGEAFDIAFNGGELYPKDFTVWRNVADIAKEYGIVWGYDLWKKDMPHFQDNGIIAAKTKLLDEYKNLTLSEKIRKLADRLITYKNLSLEEKIARLRNRNYVKKNS